MDRTFGMNALLRRLPSVRLAGGEHKLRCSLPAFWARQRSDERTGTTRTYIRSCNRLLLTTAPCLYRRSLIQATCGILDESAVAKLAANCGDVNIARFRDCTKVLISRVPQVGNLTCERIVDRERVDSDFLVVVCIHLW